MSRRCAASRYCIALLAAAAAIAVAACSTEPFSLGDLGLTIEVDIEAGRDFQVTVPLDPHTTVTVAASGVTAHIAANCSQGSMLLKVDVGPDNPRGAYNLGLLAVRGGKKCELDRPFTVIEPVTETAADQADADTAATGLSPETLRDELIAALAAQDATGARRPWPESSCDSLGGEVLVDVAPRPAEGDCENVGPSDAHCFVLDRPLRWSSD